MIYDTQDTCLIIKIYLAIFTILRNIILFTCFKAKIESSIFQIYHDDPRG